MTESKWDLKAMKDSLTGRGRIIPAVQAVVAREAAEDSAARDTKFLHPSEICKKDWCPRASWYNIKSGSRPVQSATLNRMNIFAEGNAIHSKWQRWIGKAGILEGNWLCKTCNVKWWATSPQVCPVCGEGTNMKYKEVPISDEDHHLIGHADGIIDDGTKAVLEIKSVGTGTLRYEAPDLFMPYSKGEITLEEMWKRIRTPFASHVRQVSLYMHCLGIKDAVILYEWKPTQDFKEFNLKFQPSQISGILEGCKSVKRALDTNTPVMRPQWADNEKHSTCKKCDHRDKCWSLNDDDQTASPQRASSDGEVPVEVRPPTPASSESTTSAGSGRVVRRSFDE